MFRQFADLIATIEGADPSGTILTMFINVLSSPNEIRANVVAWSLNRFFTALVVVAYRCLSKFLDLLNLFISLYKHFVDNCTAYHNDFDFLCLEMISYCGHCFTFYDYFLISISIDDSAAILVIVRRVDMVMKVKTSSVAIDKLRTLIIPNLIAYYPELSESILYVLQCVTGFDMTRNRPDHRMVTFISWKRGCDVPVWSIPYLHLSNLPFWDQLSTFLDLMRLWGPLDRIPGQAAGSIGKDPRASQLICLEVLSRSVRKADGQPVFAQNWVTNARAEGQCRFSSPPPEILPIHNCFIASDFGDSGRLNCLCAWHILAMAKAGSDAVLDNEERRLIVLVVIHWLRI